MKTLRIFVSSPGDVRPERVRAYDVLQKLQTKFRAFLQIEPILWEHEAMRATATFQAQILPPSKTDIVVCVLWARIGMRLPSDYRRPDGTVPTGTEWEFEDAFASHVLRGTPDLLVYRKTALPTIQVESDEQLAEWQRQKKALDLFLDYWSRDHEGAFKAAFNTFTTDEEFAAKLEQHLEKIINKKLQTEAGADPEEQKITWFEGSPFLGLRAFQPEHAPVFFGRELATMEIVDRLKTQGATGRVFLMLLGMSGCGKSSLARAGVIPATLRPGETDFSCWRYTILRPSDSAAGLLLSLAESLLCAGALPEIAGLGYNAEALAALFKAAPIQGIPLIQAALQRAGRAFSQQQLRSTDSDARLLLLIDQFEELFTIEGFRPEVDGFIATIAALSKSGLVWVLVTMRSDMYARGTDSETLRQLKGEDGQYDVTVPGFAELAQMIRMPATAAGLHYELDPQSGRKLDDAILEEAWKNPEALPLLEFTLDELYKARTESNVLTWKSYRDLGGMAGAIAKRAEAEYGRLSDQAKEALPLVFSRVISFEHDKAIAAFAVSADLYQIGGGEEVVRRFVGANLFVTNASPAGETVVSLSHEALLDSWPRLRDWIASNREFLRVKYRLAEFAQRWIDAGKDRDYLLPSGKPLAEAEDAVRRRRKELAPQEIALVEASSKTVRSKRRRRRYAVIAVTLLIFTILAYSAVTTRYALRLAQAQSAQLKKDLSASEALVRAIMEFPTMEAKVREAAPDQRPEQIEERVYTELAKTLGIDAETLRQKLSELSQQLKKTPNVSTFERASAAYAAKDYNGADRLALVAADEAQKGNPPRDAEAIKALELAAWCAEKQIEYPRALERFHAAALLTDRQRDAREWARVQHGIAFVLDGQGRYSEAENILLDVVATRSQVLGPEDPGTLASRNSLALVRDKEGKYAEAEAENREVLKLREKVLGPEDPDTLRSRNNLALVLGKEGKYAEAEAENREVLKLMEKVLGPEHPDTLRSRNNLALVLDKEGKYAEAEAVNRSVLELMEKVLGPEHPDTLRSRNNLAAVLGEQGKYVEAEAEFRAVLNLTEKVLGPEHPDTLRGRNSLAIVLDNEGKYTEAEAEYRAVLELMEKVLGPEHPDTLRSRNNLALVLDKEGKYAEAEAVNRSVLELMEKVLGPEHPDTLRSRNNLAAVLGEQGKYVEAEAEFRAVLNLTEKVLGPEHPDTLRGRNSLAIMLDNEGKYTEAEAEYRAVLKLMEKVLGPEHPDTLAIRNNLAAVLDEEGKYTEAEAEYRTVLKLMEKVLGPEHPDTLRSRNRLAWILATCPDANIRNGSEAMALATNVCELSQWSNAAYLDTLAAAEAEAGQLDAAIKHEQQALDLAKAHKGDVKDYESRLSLYQQHKPYRMAPTPTAIPTPTATPRPSPTPRPASTPRPRSTPAPRP